MVNNLELLHEGFRNETDELESMLQYSNEFVLKAKQSKFNYELKNVISNLNGLCDSLYSEFENNNESEYEDLIIKYNVLHEILSNLLPYEEKIYLQIKHGIELD